MTTSPDIIVPLTSDPNGVQAWIWIDYFGVDRNGTAPLVTEQGTEDKWRISPTIRASLAKDNQILLDVDGNEIPTAIPKEFAERSKSVDVNALKHDIRVLQAVGLIRSVLIDIYNGTLVPIIEPTEPVTPE
jgi:hypothetical protein